MPFPQQVPQPFTRESISSLFPGQIGVYGLFNSGGWIYIGRGDMRNRLLDHLNGDNAWISLFAPTH